MGKGGRILAIELGISMSIVVWSAVSRKYWPWPPNVNRVAFAYGVLGVLAVANEELAALLAAGFLLAQVLKTPVDAEGNFKFTGGIPPGIDDDKTFKWYYLTWGRDPEYKPGSKSTSPGTTGGSRGLQPIGETPSSGIVSPGTRDGSIPIQT